MVERKMKRMNDVIRTTEDIRFDYGDVILVPHRNAVHRQTAHVKLTVLTAFITCRFQ